MSKRISTQNHGLPQQLLDSSCREKHVTAPPTLSELYHCCPRRGDALRQATASTLWPSSLLRYNVNATLPSYRPTDSARLLRHKNVVIAGIDRDAMRIGIYGQVE